MDDFTAVVVGMDRELSVLVDKLIVVTVDVSEDFFVVVVIDINRELSVLVNEFIVTIVDTCEEESAVIVEVGIMEGPVAVDVVAVDVAAGRSTVIKNNVYNKITHNT